MNERFVDICIIGGGASGLVAAIKARETNPEASLIILEKLPQPGHKVAAAGNGRCNLSNIESSEWERTSLFFSEIGLVTRIDSDGRVYPYSEDGRDVVSLLKKACQRLGAEIVCRREVKSIDLDDKVDDYKFTITTHFNKPKAYRSGENVIRGGLLDGITEDEDIVLRARKVLISTGGKSKPKMGTQGDGYRFARELGHTVTSLIPVLTGIETEEDFRDLAGVRQKVKVTLREAKIGTNPDKEIFSDYGEIQFTEYGISGICIFDMTRFMEGRDFSKYEIEVDFLPEISKSSLETLMEGRDNICSLVKAPLAKRIMEESEEDISRSLKSFRIHPKGLRGWDMAQVTRGGVPLSEINSETGESLIVSGLFFSGEVLDLDFRCGGFNLQNAWTTGIRAGLNMGKSLNDV